MDDACSTPLPRQVLLFSGHMIDAPGRAKPRFPADREPIARRALERLLADLGVGGDDLAIHGGACGGDVLFGEIALARGAACEICIPFAEPEFLAASVDFAGADWRRRFAQLAAHGTLHVLPEELGPTPAGEDPYERNNRRMLELASRHGPQRLQFVCLWDGGGGDGPGGTRHLLQEVADRGGRTHWIDTTTLW